MEAEINNTLKRDIKKFDQYAMACGTDYNVMIVGNEHKHKIVGYSKVDGKLTCDDPENGNIKFFGTSGMFNWWDNEKVLVKKFHQAIEWYNREDVINTYRIDWTSLVTFSNADADKRLPYVYFDGIAFRGTDINNIMLNREAGQIAYYLEDKKEALKAISLAMTKTAEFIERDINLYSEEAERLIKKAKKLKEESGTQRKVCSSCGSSSLNSQARQVYQREARDLEKKAEAYMEKHNALKEFKKNFID